MHRAALLLLALSACGDGPSEHTVDLSFAARIGDQPASCGPTYTLGVDGTEAQLADARLFVSDIALRDAGGSWHEVTLDEDGVWQSGGVVLLDFEDGSAACADSGTPETNDRVIGTLPAGTYEAVRFTVGVPFERNHVENTSAPAPLNAPGMFWTWQGGYKFVRVDLMLGGDEPSRWNTHVGSTGCVSDSAVSAPSEPCGKPNRATIELEGIGPDSTIDLDLGALFADTDLLADTLDTPPGCMSMPMEPADCEHSFATLGLDFGSGVCSGDCSDQTLFGVLP